MTKNIGNIDRLIRTIVGIVLLILTLYTGGVLQIVLAVVGAILLATGLIGFCPLYKVLNLNTRDKKDAVDKK